MVTIPVRLLLERGDRPFRDIVTALRCSACGTKPAPVYLVAGLTRSFCFGPPPSWSVELVPPAAVAVAHSPRRRRADQRDALGRSPR
jgi:hypothetical protein